MAEYDNSVNENKDNRNRRNALLILLCILLLGSIGFNIYQYNSHVEKEKILNEELVSSGELKKTLQTQLDSAKVQLNEYMGRNAALDSEITKREAELVTKAEQIDKLLRSNKINYNKYLNVKDQLAEMRYYADKYLKQIQALSEENKKLAAQNEDLKGEVKEKKKTIDNLTDKNVSLSNKVSLASRLQTTDVTVTGVKFKGNNKESETNRAKHIQKLKICFTLAENRIANSGKRDVFVQVVDPHGQTISIESLGSGVTDVEGDKAQYTTKDEIEFNNDPQNYCLYWGKDTPFEAGKYNIVLYTEGYKLGEKAFTIK
jgi:cell division protein FtsB